MTMYGDLHFIDPASTVSPTVHYSGNAAPQRYSDAYRWYATAIENGRMAPGPLRLDERGFELVAPRLDTAVFESDDSIREQYIRC